LRKPILNFFERELGGELVEVLEVLVELFVGLLIDVVVIDVGFECCLICI
jgi:hypothetical protein